MRFSKAVVLKRYQIWNVTVPIIRVGLCSPFRVEEFTIEKASEMRVREEVASYGDREFSDYVVLGKEIDLQCRSIVECVELIRRSKGCSDGMFLNEELIFKSSHELRDIGQFKLNYKSMS